MRTIDPSIARRLEAALLGAEEALPYPPRAIMRMFVLRRVLLRSCSDDEGMLGQWDQGRQALSFCGPNIERLSPAALYALVAHEAAHIWFHFRNDPRGRQESEVADLAAQWGADLAALYGETGRGTGRAV
jgi:hypothetical protein